MNTQHYNVMLVDNHNVGRGHNLGVIEILQPHVDESYSRLLSMIHNSPIELEHLKFMTVQHTSTLHGYVIDYTFHDQDGFEYRIRLRLVRVTYVPYDTSLLKKEVFIYPMVDDDDGNSTLASSDEQASHFCVGLELRCPLTDNLIDGEDLHDELSTREEADRLYEQETTEHPEYIPGGIQYS